MLQQLAVQTGAQAWVVSSMLFFIAVFVAVTYWVQRTPSQTHLARARLPLDDLPERNEPFRLPLQAKANGGSASKGAEPNPDRGAA